MINKELILERLRQMHPEDVRDIVLASLDESGVKCNSQTNGILFYGLSQSDFTGTNELAFAFSMLSAGSSSLPITKYTSSSSEDFIDDLVEFDYYKCVNKFNMANYIPAA